MMNDPNFTFREMSPILLSSNSEEISPTVLAITNDQMQAQMLEALQYSHNKTKIDIAMEVNQALSLIKLRL